MIHNYNYRYINFEEIIYENLSYLVGYNLIILYYKPYFNFIEFSRKYLVAEDLPELIDEMRRKIIDMHRTRIEISDLAAIKNAEKVERIADRGFVVRNAGELGEILESIRV